jgi:hypothetical protein
MQSCGLHVCFKPPRPLPSAPSSPRALKPPSPQACTRAHLQDCNTHPQPACSAFTICHCRRGAVGAAALAAGPPQVLVCMECVTAHTPFELLAAPAYGSGRFVAARQAPPRLHTQGRVVVVAALLPVCAPARTLDWAPPSAPIGWPRPPVHALFPPRYRRNLAPCRALPCLCPSRQWAACASHTLLSPLTHSLSTIIPSCCLDPVGQGAEASDPPSTFGHALSALCGATPLPAPPRGTHFGRCRHPSPDPSTHPPPHRASPLYSVSVRARRLRTYTVVRSTQAHRVPKTCCALHLCVPHCPCRPAKDVCTHMLQRGPFQPSCSPAACFIALRPPALLCAGGAPPQRAACPCRGGPTALSPLGPPACSAVGLPGGAPNRPGSAPAISTPWPLPDWRLWGARPSDWLMSRAVPSFPHPRPPHIYMQAARCGAGGATSRCAAALPFALPAATSGSTRPARFHWKHFGRLRAS